MMIVDSPSRSSRNSRVRFWRGTNMLAERPYCRENCLRLVELSRSTKVGESLLDMGLREEARAAEG